MFLYSAVSSLSTQSTSHFTPWQTCSFPHQLGLAGKHSSHAAITARRLFTHISTAVRYLSTQIRDRKCPCFEVAAKAIQPPSPSIETQASYYLATMPHSNSVLYEMMVKLYSNTISLHHRYLMLGHEISMSVYSSLLL